MEHCKRTHHPRGERPAARGRRPAPTSGDGAEYYFNAVQEYQSGRDRREQGGGSAKRGRGGGNRMRPYVEGVPLDIRRHPLMTIGICGLIYGVSLNKRGTPNIRWQRGASRSN